MAPRPSSLPMLAACPRWEPGVAGEAAEQGSLRHSALAKHFAGEPDALVELDDEQADAVKWAAQQIRILGACSDYTPVFEHTLTAPIDDFDDITGTPDCVVGLDIFDLKWRERDYTAQMAAYALLVLNQPYGMPQPVAETVRVHILYGAFRKIETLQFTLETARKIVVDIVNGAGRGEPTPCEYCSWCSRRIICEAYTKRVNAVVAGREDWELGGYHTSEVKTSEEAGKMLRIARLLKGWITAAEFRAHTMATKEGIIPEGFKLKSRAGKRFITDAAGAFEALDISQADFLTACEVRLNTSKKYPDKAGVIDVFAKANGLKKGAAKKQVEEKLGPVTRSGAATLALVADKEDNSTEGDEDASF